MASTHSYMNKANYNNINYNNEQKRKGMIIILKKIRHNIKHNISIVLFSLLATTLINACLTVH